MDETREEVEEVELEDEDAALLPEREAMSLIDFGETGGLGPPALHNVEGVETPPIISDPPPTE